MKSMSAHKPVAWKLNLAAAALAAAYAMTATAQDPRPPVTGQCGNVKLELPPRSTYECIPDGSGFKAKVYAPPANLTTPAQRSSWLLGEIKKTHNLQGDLSPDVRMKILRGERVELPGGVVIELKGLAD